ncbi:MULTISPECIES: plasmid partitioning protein RepB C-terminal domain-containing protein [Luteibacter]|uniref:plasmid partitioning protein RepB C-terminal domain-containing protein n=1 Tax=Luteibacter TaxID=242605 RepID=UPI0009DD5B24
MSEDTVRQRFRLLNGICEEASGLLADSPCPAKVFSVLRQMKAVSQIEPAELMPGNRNCTLQFANAI